MVAAGIVRGPAPSYSRQAAEAPLGHFWCSVCHNYHPALEGIVLTGGCGHLVCRRALSDSAAAKPSELQTCFRCSAPLSPSVLAELAQAPRRADPAEGGARGRTWLSRDELRSSIGPLTEQARSSEGMARFWSSLNVCEGEGGTGALAALFEARRNRLRCELDSDAWGGALASVARLRRVAVAHGRLGAEGVAYEVSVKRDDPLAFLAGEAVHTYGEVVVEVDFAGGVGGPFAGREYHVRATIPTRYPHEEVVFAFLDTPPPWHPNVDARDGRVAGWRVRAGDTPLPAITLEAALRALQALLAAPVVVGADAAVTVVLDESAARAFRASPAAWAERAAARTAALAAEASWRGVAGEGAAAAVEAEGAAASAVTAPTDTPVPLHNSL